MSNPDLDPTPEARLAMDEKGLLREIYDFLGKVQGVALGVAMSGDSHPNPDEALMDLFHDAQKHAWNLHASLKASQEAEVVGWQPIRNKRDFECFPEASEYLYALFPTKRDAELYGAARPLYATPQPAPDAEVKP